MKVLRPGIQVSVERPTKHRNGAPFHVLGHDALLASQHPNWDAREHPLSRVSRWNRMPVHLVP